MKDHLGFNQGRKRWARAAAAAIFVAGLCLTTSRTVAWAQGQDDKDDEGGRLRTLIRAEQPPAPCTPNQTATRDVATVADRSDVVNLPAPLQTRLLQLAARPHTYLPIHAFAEAVNSNGSPKPSQLFQYYLIDTNSFQPNIFTTKAPESTTMPSKQQLTKRIAPSPPLELCAWW